MSVHISLLPFAKKLDPNRSQRTDASSWHLSAVTVSLALLMRWNIGNCRKRGCEGTRWFTKPDQRRRHLNRRPCNVFNPWSTSLHAPRCSPRLLPALVLSFSLVVLHPFRSPARFFSPDLRRDEKISLSFTTWFPSLYHYIGTRPVI